MSLADDIAAEAADVFLNTDDFAVAATYKVGGLGSGSACTIVVNESDAALAILRESQAEGRSAIISAPVATVATPHRGDSFTVASGVAAGVWIVNEPEDRDAGIVNLRCRLETTRNTVAESAIEVRQ